MFSKPKQKGKEIYLLGPMKIGEVLNSIEQRIKVKHPNLKPREDICQEQPIREQIRKLFAIKMQRKEKAERKDNSMSQQERSLVRSDYHAN